jgi:exonuclease SbcD
MSQAVFFAFCIPALLPVNSSPFAAFIFHATITYFVAESALRLFHTSDWHLGQNLHGQGRDFENGCFLM